MSGKTLKFDLLPWQREVMDSEARFKVVVAGRRCGKSRFAIVQTLIAALQCKEADASVVYVAPTIAMVKVLAWDALLQFGGPVIANSNVNEGKIKLLNGVSIYCRGADNPDTLRGMKLAYAVLDETKDLKDNLFEMIIRPALSDMRGGALIIGTPSPDAEQFRQYYDLGQRDNTGEWASWHKTTLDNPLIDRSEIDAAKRTLSTVAFEQEYMASFDTTGANVLRLEWFKTAEPPEGEYSTYIAIDPDGYENVTGDDRKKRHLDYFAIAVVRVYDNGHWWVQKVDYGRWDVRESAVRVLMAIRAHRPMCVGIEKGPLMRALMPYLTDLMRKNNVYAHVEPIPHGGQSKTNRITYALQGLLEHGRITFNQKENWDEIKREMLAFPSERAHDDCFPADTEIITAEGVKRIVDVTTNDCVLTRQGFRRVLKAWCKGNKHVITRFGITATPEHRIFTQNKGWVSLDSIANDDILIVANTVKETSCERQLNSTEGNTTDIPKRSNLITEGITHPTISGNAPQDSSIEIYGNSIMEPSPMGITSTMQTKTSTTTTFQTLSAFQVQPIMWNIKPREAQDHALLSTLNTLDESGVLQMSGTKQKNASNGQESMPNDLYLKTSRKNHVESAESHSNQKFQKQQCAAKNASELTQMQSNLKNIIVPVYDIMVEGEHEFFANGVLVHNCIDAVSMIAHLCNVVYAKPQETEEYEIIDEVCGF